MSMTCKTPPTDPLVTPELVRRYGLTGEEFQRIKKILGREPNFTELGIFSVMWSEHCSYKNSKKELKKFATVGPNILVKAGEENAGVVSGIRHYGIFDGIPTIGGEIYFDESFEGNPLINVCCLGVLRHEQLARGTAEGAGNPVFYVGAETGRDGLAGAAFASRELTEQSREDRPAVQVGDPFKEKLLLEACLELLARGAIAGIQDMGAAGLTCSTCETASRA